MRHIPDREEYDEYHRQGGIVGIRIRDTRDGVEGYILRSYGQAFSALMKDETVRYYCRGSDQFELSAKSGS